MIKRIYRGIKKIVKYSLNDIDKLKSSNLEYKNDYDDLLFMFDKYVNNAVPRANNFNFNLFSNEIISFVESMKVSESYSYRYAPSVSQPNIYNSIYACLLFFLLDKNNIFSKEELYSWGKHINSFQREDGFYIDKNIEAGHYYDIDWWGARHLSPHVIIALNYIGMKPKYEFNYIKKYYDKKELKNYLNSLDFDNIIGTDPDNALMNLGVLLQYQRDFFGDIKAGETLGILFDELEKRINPRWGSWLYGSDDDMHYLSRTQQFAYHLYPLWLYDKRPIQHINKLIDLTLKTQTVLGGFGARLNSSACEDIDAIFLLIKLSELTPYRKDDVNLSLAKYFPWVLSNQNSDGGFVFNRNEPFTYGHTFMSSKKNESHLFATWFRTLSIAYLTKYLGLKNNFNIGRCPGYHF